MDLVLIRREGVKNLKIIAGVIYGCEEALRMDVPF